MMSIKEVRLQSLIKGRLECRAWLTIEMLRVFKPKSIAGRLEFRKNLNQDKSALKVKVAWKIAIPRPKLDNNYYKLQDWMVWVFKMKEIIFLISISSFRMLTLTQLLN